MSMQVVADPVLALEPSPTYPGPTTDPDYVEIDCVHWIANDHHEDF